MPDSNGYQAWIEVLPDFSKTQSKANSQLTSIMSNAGDTSAHSFGGSFKSGVGQIFTGNFLADIAGSFARGVGELIGTGIRAGIDYAIGSVSFASALQQSQGAVDSIFKAGAATVHKYALSASKDLGLSQNGYNELASVIGAQLKNGGTSLDVLGDKTNDLIKIGSDLSAQFGGTTQQAVESLSSALKGERDPIEKYGVSLTQAGIDAKAAELGFDKVNGTLSTQATQAATLALILQQTADATGQFAAQSGSLAEQQQILNAQLEDAQTKLGTALLPTATDLAAFANEELIPILGAALAQAGPELAASIEENLPKIKELLGSAASDLPKAVDAAIGFASAAGDSLQGDLKTLDDTQRVFEEVNGFFTQYLPAWAAGTVPVQESWDGFFNWWDLAWDGTADTVKNKSDQIKAYWDTSLAALLQSAADQRAGMMGAGLQLAQGFTDGIETGAEAAILAAERMALRTVAKTRLALQIQSPSKVFEQIGGYIGEGLAIGIDGTQGLVASSIGSLVSIPSPSLPGSVVGSTTGSSTGSVRDVHFHTEDPMVAYQMMQNELNAGLAVLRK